MSAPQDPLDRFGTGTARPFRVGAAGVETASGEEKVLMDVEQVLGTPVGKLPWRCKFGARLTRLRHHNNNNVLQQLARVDSADALALWEPRAKLHSVVAAPRVPSNRNVLDLTARVKIGTSARSVKVVL